MTAVERERLEREANMARARLATTIDEIDRRAHEAVDVKLQLRRHAAPLAVAAGIVVLPIVAAIGVGIYRLATRDARMRRERVRALKRGWRHPDRLARYKNPPLAVEMGRRILVGAVTYVAIQAIKRTLDGRFPKLVAARP